MAEESRRAYRSPTRAAKAGETRSAILANFAEQLGRPGAAGLSVPEAARAAGVSVRMVYLYFPDDEARIAALAEWIEAELLYGAPALALHTAEDLPAMTRSLYAAAGRNLPLVRAQARADFRLAVRRKRLGNLRAAISKVLADIGAQPKVTKRATAVVQLLMSADAGMPLVDVHGLSIRDAGDAAAEAVAAMVSELRRQAPPSL